ncbi:MAG: alpha/beta hydrolase [Desulfatibacillaceae bacterium]
MEHSEKLARLDDPRILRHLFHPRRQTDHTPPAGARDWCMDANDGTRLCGRFYLGDPSWCNILFFHGNGEIAPDYDAIGPMYHSIQANFLVMDYRGYGQSGGSPTVSHMLHDAHGVCDAVRTWLSREGRNNGPFVIMGRSLGSAPSLEIAAAYQPDVDGLVIESGFSRTIPLLRRLGISAQSLGLDDSEDGISNLDKMRQFRKPTLIIHAEHDHIIPHDHGVELFEACPATEKRMFTVRGANHNDIFIQAGMAYFNEIRGLLDKVE